MHTAFYCAERDELAARLKSRLRLHTTKFRAAMAAHGSVEADKETHFEYTACIQARLALQAHEAEHGCGIQADVQERPEQPRNQQQT